MPDTESIERFVRVDAPAELRAHFRKDSQAAAFVTRQLTQVLTKVYEKKYPELEMIEGGVIPIDRTVNEGARYYEYHVMDGTGMAVFMDDYAGDDMPMASLRMSSRTAATHVIGEGFEYSNEDTRAASFAGTNLNQALANLCRRHHLEKHNRTALWGSKPRGLTGFVNHPNVPEFAPLPDPDLAGETRWALKNPLLVSNDIANMKAQVRKTTKKAHRINKIVMPDDVMGVLEGKVLTTTSGGVTTLTGQTVMSFLQSVHKDVEFGSISDLSQDESEGNLDSNVAIAFQGGDPDIVSYVLPMDFKVNDPQWHGLMVQFPCESKSGGVNWKYPLSACRMKRI